MANRDKMAMQLNRLEDMVTELYMVLLGHPPRLAMDDSAPSASLYETYPFHSTSSFLIFDIGSYIRHPLGGHCFFATLFAHPPFLQVIPLSKFTSVLLYIG